MSNKTLSAVLIAAGLLLLAWAGLVVFDRSLAQRRGAVDLRQPDRQAPSPGDLESGAPMAQAEVLRRPAPGSTIARIRIDSLGVDGVAFEGIDPATLERGIGHFPGTALPGENSNASFAGHRDSFFRGLGGVEIGSSIVVETRTASHSYRVTETRVVEPAQVEVVQGRGSAELTLVTCYPFDYIGPAPQRFVVHAELITTVEQGSSAP